MTLPSSLRGTKQEAIQIKNLKLNTYTLNEYKFYLYPKLIQEK